MSITDRPVRPSWSTRTTHRARPGRPHPSAVHALEALAGLGLGGTLALFAGTETGGALTSPGGWFLAGGRLAGFVGAYALALLVVLVARLPLLERAVGQDRLVRWHRTVAPWAVGSIAVHVVTITLGYAEMSHLGVVSQVTQFLFHYPDMLAAVVAFGLLLVASFSSHRIARRRMRYETWWVIHLYLYLAVALAVAHQIHVGVPFLGHTDSTVAWLALWAVVAAILVGSRVVVPLVRNSRHQLRVAEVLEVAPGVHSLTLVGTHLEDLAVAGGQFFQWRFLAPGLWWHSHPYSLSALPQPPYLRVTVKALGDQSTLLSRLRPGTRVIAEGPYGTFTADARTSDRVLLVGAGVGVTPLRALAEDLPERTDVIAILRGTTPEDLVHRDEMAEIVGARGGVVHDLVGSRHQVRLDARALRRLVPDLAQRDVYVCGPEGFTRAVVAAARGGAVPLERIHVESFAF